MAKPVSFPEANKMWLGDTEKDIVDLPVFQEGNESISCWELSAEELSNIQATGKVWLYVVGVHPPVFVSGLPLFREDKNDSSRTED